jgi:hypothetical protein
MNMINTCGKLCHIMLSATSDVNGSVSSNHNYPPWESRCSNDCIASYNSMLWLDCKLQPITFNLHFTSKVSSLERVFDWRFRVVQSFDDWNNQQFRFFKNFRTKEPPVSVQLHLSQRPTYTLLHRWRKVSGLSQYLPCLLAWKRAGHMSTK